ncbi:MAG: dihydrofolate reductase [Sandaracinaceae bacterium]|nr:dihydrofolate reductase [Sandaracinaceae bacterium]
MRLALIAAVARSGVIGRAGDLPWRLPADMKQFKARTMGRPVIMGRKTWESLRGPLPGRLNLVVTRQAGYVAEGAEVAASPRRPSRAPSARATRPS